MIDRAFGNGGVDRNSNPLFPRITCRENQPKAGNAGFLTELGIDRLHPEPKNDVLGPGTPKNQ